MKSQGFPPEGGGAGRAYTGDEFAGGRRMAKTHFNIQDQFLNQVRKARIQVVVSLQSGETIRGFIRSFDSFCIIIENEQDVMLVYKHALNMIRPSEHGTKIPGLI